MTHTPAGLLRPKTLINQTGSFPQVSPETCNNAPLKTSWKDRVTTLLCKLSQKPGYWTVLFQSLARWPEHAQDRWGQESSAEAPGWPIPQGRYASRAPFRSHIWSQTLLRRCSDLQFCTQFPGLLNEDTRIYLRGLWGKDYHTEQTCRWRQGMWGGPMGLHTLTLESVSTCCYSLLQATHITACIIPFPALPLSPHWPHSPLLFAFTWLQAQLSYILQNLGPGSNLCPAHTAVDRDRGVCVHMCDTLNINVRPAV